MNDTQRLHGMHPLMHKLEINTISLLLKIYKNGKYLTNIGPIYGINDSITPNDIIEKLKSGKIFVNIKQGIFYQSCQIKIMQLEKIKFK